MIALQKQMFAYWEGLSVAEEKAEMIAVCGIDCSDCDIRRAKSDPETMDDVIKWFREKLNKELVLEQVCCDWCLGPL